MLQMTITILGMLGLMWLASTLVSHQVVTYLRTKVNLDSQTQKEIKWLISSIITILTGLFSLLYLLLSR